uniref:GRAM domain-containing protein n=1 Tax=Trichobilharzia regenti TaxID=157069 RepID=A0AA85KCD6_TRIRE|nr:unnamed protein product [Trichobilharzia regenti]
MSETQLLNSTSDTNPDYTSSQISTSWSHLPVKFICCDADQEELDDPASPVEGGSRGDESAHEHVRNQFGSDTSQPLRGTSSLGLNGVKSNLRNSLASIPNHLSVEYSNNRQSNSTKSVSPDCSTTSLLRTSKTSTSMLTMDTSKQHTSNTNVVVVGNDVDGVIDKIPSIGVRSNSNITISSWSTVQSRHHIDKSSPRQLSNQNVFKSSTRASSKRLANLYNSLTPSYRSKLDQFRRIFRGTPVDTDRLLVDYSCALSKNNNGLLLQGRMYITETWVCFYSKILYEQKLESH